MSTQEQVVPDNVTVTVPASKQDIARLEQRMALLEGRLITTVAQLVESLPLGPTGGSRPSIVPTTTNETIDDHNVAFPSETQPVQLPSADATHSSMHAMMPRRRTTIPDLVISPRRTRHKPPLANKLQVRLLTTLACTSPILIETVQADVREYARYIMNRTDSSSSLPDPPSAEELTRYSRTGIMNMTLANFRVDLNGGAKSRWNAVAAEIFADGFIDSQWYECRDHERIQDAFIAHLKSLKSRYAEQQRGDDQDSPQKMHQREYNRRQISVSLSRLVSSSFG